MADDDSKWLLTSNPRRLNAPLGGSKSVVLGVRFTSSPRFVENMAAMKEENSRFGNAVSSASAGGVSACEMK